MTRSDDAGKSLVPQSRYVTSLQEPSSAQTPRRKEVARIRPQSPTNLFRQNGHKTQKDLAKRGRLAAAFPVDGSESGPFGKKMSRPRTVGMANESCGQRLDLTFQPASGPLALGPNRRRPASRRCPQKRRPRSPTPVVGSPDVGPINRSFIVSPSTFMQIPLSSACDAG